MGSEYSKSTGAETTPARSATTRIGSVGSTVGSTVGSATRGIQTTSAQLGETTAATQNLATQSAGLLQAGQQLGQTIRPVTAPVARGIKTGSSKVYAMLQQEIAKRRGVTGGGSPGFFGGDSDADPLVEIREYRDTVAAQAKTELIRGIARSLKNIGIKVDPEASSEQIVAQLLEVLPKPSAEHGKLNSSESQRKVCESVARALNNEFTPGHQDGPDALIPLDGDINVICRRVTKYVKSFAAGLHSEFLAVHRKLEEALAHLKITGDIMEKSYNKIIEDLKEKGEASSKIENADNIYRRARALQMEQVELIKNFLDVTLAPADKELSAAMKGTGKAHDLVKNLGLTPGGPQYTEAIINMIAGFGTLASVTERVNKALKEVGLSVSEYLDSKSFKELESMTDKKLPKAKDTAEFLKAVRTLRDNFDRRQELQLGGGDDSDSSSDDEMDAFAHGGAHGSARHMRGGEEEHAIDRRIKAQKESRRIIVEEFSKRVTKHFNAFLDAVNRAGPELGKTIPLSDKLALLRDMLKQMESIGGSARVEYALIGYWTEAEARQRKESFVNSLRMVIGVLDEIISLEMYQKTSQYFAAMREPLRAILDAIDYFTDAIQKKFGSGAQGGARGGALEEDFPDVSAGANRSALDIRSAANAFAYFYYVAAVRENLKRTGKELKVYGEDYVKLLAQAIGSRQNQLAVEAQQLTAAVSTNEVLAALDGMGMNGESVVNSAKEFVRRQYAVKEEFYKSLEALDLYMKVFTDALVNDPDSVKSVGRMLKGVDVIAPFYDETSGNALAGVFEKVRNAAEALSGIDPAAGEHYYTQLRNADGTVKNVGSASQGYVYPGAELDALQDQVNATFDHFKGLKNLVNAFVRIGDKLGGTELRRQVFMSPTQIYNALIRYLKTSALSIIGGGEGVLPVLVYLSGGIQPGNYVVEDRFFTYMIKSISAKILTLIGVYDLFERPSPVYDLTPTRMIVGGGYGDAPPEVIEEATELYFRLPRLVSFYKNLLGSPDYQGAVDKQIALLPDLEGTFAGLIRFVFLRAGASPSDYTELEAQDLIREINKIYLHYREKHGAEKAVKESIYGLIDEVNRRYGVVKKADWEKYMAMITEMRQAQWGDRPQLNRTNYAILPGEEEYEPTRMAPSDAYRVAPGGVAAGVAAAAPPKNPLDPEPYPDGRWIYEELLQNFRGKLDEMFTMVGPNDYTHSSYGSLIMQAQQEIRRQSTASEKLQTVQRLIQGSRAGVGGDAGKNVAFHETVVVGLNALSRLFSILSAVRDRVSVTYLTHVADVANALNGAAAGAAYAATLTGMPVEDANTSLVGKAGIAIWTAQQVFDWAIANKGGANAQAVLGIAARLLVNEKRVMTDLLSVIYQLTGGMGGLVEVNFPNTVATQISLDFTKVRGLIQDLIGGVRAHLDLFRASMPAETIQKYEGNPQNPELGSLFQIERDLVDGMLRGQRTTGGLPVDAELTIDQFGQAINKSFVELISDTGISAQSFAELAVGAVAGAGATPAAVANVETQFNQFGEAFSAIFFYDASEGANSGTGLGTTAGLAAVPVLGGLIKPSKADAAFTGAYGKFDDWNNQSGLVGFRSILSVFNQMVAKYLYRFYDPATGKIYSNLINSLVGGPYAQQIVQASQGNSFPDIATVGTGFGARGDPKPNATLYQSLALILQRLATDTNQQTQVSDHLVSTLSEVPMYMKEAYRAELPIFNKVFTQISQQCGFLQQVMQRTGVKLGRPRLAMSTVGFRGPILPAPGANDYPPNALNSLFGVADDNSPGAVKQRLNAFADAINTGAFTMADIAANVLRELADRPIFLEVGENSIQLYRQRYGKDPLMPISAAMLYLAPVDAAQRAASESLMLPDHATGSPEFKLQYGTRGILASGEALSFENAPGVRAILEMYNATANKREQIDAQKYLGLAQSALRALRFATDVSVYRSLTSSTITAEQPPFTLKPIYELANPVSVLKTLEIVESSYQEEQLKRISETVGQNGAVALVGVDPRREQIVNIIDLNIMPINVHALMRQIPLVNLYNYSYTFDQMACSIYGASVNAIKAISLAPAARDPAIPTMTTRKVFLKLLLDPYAETDVTTYGSDATRQGTAGFVHRMFRGDNSLGMGRPKFLSDQIFNKALFGSLYPSQWAYDEAGPGEAAGIRRGMHIGTAANPSGYPYQTRPEYTQASRTTGLTYISKDANTGVDSPDVVKTVRFGVDITGLIDEGASRWNTRIVRDLFFIQNVLRLTRHKLDREMTQIHHILPSGHQSVTPELTEYGYNDSFGQSEVSGDLQGSLFTQ